MTTAIDAEARELFIVDAHRDDGRRFVVRSDELLSAFLELERDRRLPKVRYVNRVHFVTTSDWIMVAASR